MAAVPIPDPCGSIKAAGERIVAFARSGKRWEIRFTAG
jgi:hypothetical protein